MALEGNTAEIAPFAPRSANKDGSYNSPAVAGLNHAGMAGSIRSMGPKPNFTDLFVYGPLENGKVFKELQRINPQIDEKALGNRASTSFQKRDTAWKSCVRQSKRF